jgi:hypothetical protein
MDEKSTYKQQYSTKSQQNIDNFSLLGVNPTADTVLKTFSEKKIEEKSCENMRKLKGAKTLKSCKCVSYLDTEYRKWKST